MKINIIVKICLILVVLLASGVLIAKAIGFVSYEPNAADPSQTQMILWDNLKLTDYGLRMSNLGINDLLAVPAGSIDIQAKDLYLRKFMGFGCSGYPQTVKCATALGNIGGNTFLTIDSISQDTPLTLSADQGIDLTANTTQMEGHLSLTNGKNLIITTASNLPSATSSIYTDNVKTDLLGTATTLTLPDLQFDDDSALILTHSITINL